MITFDSIWSVFSTSRGIVCGLDAISLSAAFRIAEMELRSDARATGLRHSLFEDEPRACGRQLVQEELEEVILVIKENTEFRGMTVYNKNGSPRYDDLPLTCFSGAPGNWKVEPLADIVHS